MKTVQPPRASTSEALLGLLSFGSTSGYKLRRLIDWSIGNFWNESFGQIYPTLKRLSDAGMVTMTRKAGDRRPDSKAYELTALGREHLHAWLDSPSQPQVPRNELLLKIFFGDLVSVGVVRKQITAFRELQLAQLEHFRATEQRLIVEKGKDPRLPFWRMTLDYGFEESRGLLQWAERSLAICDRLEMMEEQAGSLAATTPTASSEPRTL